MTSTKLFIGLLATAVGSYAQGQVPQEIAALMQETRIPFVIREDVAKALSMTGSQKDRVRTVLSSAVPKGGRPPGGLGGFGGGMMRDMIRGKLRETETKILAVLSSDQKKRLTEVELQFRGPSALYQRDVRRMLKTTSAQDKAIGKIRREEEDARRKAKDRGESLPIELVWENLRAVLTTEQKDGLKSLGGAPVTFGNPSGNYAELPGQSQSGGN